VIGTHKNFSSMSANCTLAVRRSCCQTLQVWSSIYDSMESL